MAVSHNYYMYGACLSWWKLFKEGGAETGSLKISRERQESFCKAQNLFYTAVKLTGNPTLKTIQACACIIIV